MYKMFVIIMLKTEEEILAKIEELENADLDKVPVDEVEYGKYWLGWVLGLPEKCGLCRTELVVTADGDVRKYYCPKCDNK
jgi:hypothetical protein